MCSLEIFAMLNFQDQGIFNANHEGIWFLLKAFLELFTCDRNAQFCFFFFFIRKNALVSHIICSIYSFLFQFISPNDKIKEMVLHRIFVRTCKRHTQTKCD
jgi:hypothetical protein